MIRRVVTDYKMSDGTFLPRGTLLAVNQAAAHRNDETYDKPDEFLPFRFADKRDSSREESTRNQMDLHRSIISRRFQMRNEVLAFLR